MKSFLAVCALFFIAAAVRGDLTESMQKYVDASSEIYTSCATEVGLPMDMLENTSDDLSDDDKNKIGCVHSCVMKKSSIWDGSEFDMDKVKEVVEKVYDDKADEVLKSAQTCIEEVKGSGDDCTVAFMLMSCMKKNTA